MLPKGPPLGRPGLGSHVSNWLGAPHNQSRMQCFRAFFVSAANNGLWNSPVKLDTVARTPPVNPLRKSRRCNRCSSGWHSPGGMEGNYVLPKTTSRLTSTSMGATSSTMSIENEHQRWHGTPDDEPMQQHFPRSRADVDDSAMF